MRPLESAHTRRAPWSLVGGSMTVAAPFLRRPRALAVLLVTFAVIALLRWPLVPVLLALAPLSVLAAWFRRP